MRLTIKTGDSLQARSVLAEVPAAWDEDARNMLADLHGESHSRTIIVDLIL